MCFSKKLNYDKEPAIRINGFDNEAWLGYPDILKELETKISLCHKQKTILVIETYPGVNKEEITSSLKTLNPVLSIDADTVTFDSCLIEEMIKRTLTDDRVFGVMSNYVIEEFIDPIRMSEVKSQIDEIETGLVIIYGFGAGKIVQSDILVYADLARWEIQMRYRSCELGNWKANNHDEDVLKKYKRGFFFEWRMADRIKRELFEELDYLLDTNIKGQPKMISKNAYLKGLSDVVTRPFRLVPYFDSGVWGGQWMKEVCGLDPDKENYAWCFDGVPEENSLYLTYGDIRIEIPAINVVFYEPIKLLGNGVHGRFGTNFPIRFNFLDTMGGQNLSLQVHPLTEYIQDKFGMAYTQDESYYMLEAKKDACVYLGVKDGIIKEEMIKELHIAQAGENSFPDEKYINRVPAKKHDHFLIPAGTIHCSGAGSMVLEISSSMYIFTFKIWDWDRVGLDGKPRPVHLEHGINNIQWDRNPQWVEDNLVNITWPISEGKGWREERTGLHEREFIETRRHWFREKVLHRTDGNVNVLNLVEGSEAIVESPTDAFEPLIIHYAETFIVPGCIDEYTIRPYGQSIGEEIATIKAYVRV